MFVSVKALEVVVDVAHAVCESNAETFQDIVSDRSELLWFIANLLASSPSITPPIYRCVIHVVSYLCLLSGRSREAGTN